MKTQVLAVVAGIALTGSAGAGIVIHGSTTAYQNSDKDWLSHTTDDIDGNGLGTDGFFFFGDGSNDTTREVGQAFSANIQSAPSYVSGFAQGAQFLSVADDVLKNLPTVTEDYASYDDPVALNGTDTLGGIAVATVGAANSGSAGDSSEIMTFTVSGLGSGVTVRVGVLSTVDNWNDGRWDPTSITLSEGGNSATVGDHNGTQLAFVAGGTSWVFFDIDADGTYSVSATQRLATQGVSIAGLTFDSVPEPGSLALLGLGGLMMVRRRRG